MKDLKAFFAITIIALTVSLVDTAKGGNGLPSPGGIEVKVVKVIDGDTIIVAGGEKVRYAGIDTPEYGEPFFEEATEKNATLLGGSRVTLVVCSERPRDDYGRLLAFVYADGVDVSEVILGEGLARVFSRPPCGTKKLGTYKASENRARQERLGIWGLE